MVLDEEGEITVLLTRLLFRIAGSLELELVPVGLLELFGLDNSGLSTRSDKPWRED